MSLVDLWKSMYSERTLYRVKDPVAFNDRIGDSWMKGRILKNDILLCTRLSGDSFHDFVIVEEKGSHLHVALGSRFGAYASSLEKITTLSEDDFNALMRGKYLSFDPQKMQTPSQTLAP